MEERADDPMGDAGRRLAVLEREVTACRRCLRLVHWREEVARTRRRAFREETYWGRPVPGFGDPRARLLIVGLAPAAHGANRTGRMFTGDRSGEWLYRALHRAGFASRPESQARNDGLVLRDAWVTAAVRCAPPTNRPRPEEREACRAFLEAELDILLPGLRVIVALGGFAWDQVIRVLRGKGAGVPRPTPRFGHGQSIEIGMVGHCAVDGNARGAPGCRVPDGRDRLTLIGSYHPSQQNTFTGRLTEPMFDAVWQEARQNVELL